MLLFFQVVDIFYQELEKVRRQVEDSHRQNPSFVFSQATANKDSPLRLWLNLIFASKNDLQSINRQIDELRSHKLGEKLGQYATMGGWVGNPVPVGHSR